MPRVLVIVLAVAVVALAGAALRVLYVIPRPETTPAVLAGLVHEPNPGPAPDVSFVDGTGHSVKLSAFRGRLVLLNVWATWCAPCVRELPALGRLQAALGTAGFAVVDVNAGRESASDTAAFLKAHDAGALAVYRDPDLRLLQAFGAQGLPFSVVVNAKGNEIARASGPLAWDDPAAIDYFRGLANGATAPAP